MQNKKDDSALKTDFLAAYHSILFSKTSDNDIDVERRRLAVKYLTARKFESESTASLLLNQGLKQYENAIEKTGFFKTITSKDKKNNAEWRTNLKDVQKALTLIKPLPCQRKSSDKVCGRRELVDRDVERLMNLPENNEETLPRKIPSIFRTAASRFERETPVGSNDGFRSNSGIARPQRIERDQSSLNDNSSWDPVSRRQPRNAFQTDKEERVAPNLKDHFGRRHQFKHPPRRYEEEVFPVSNQREGFRNENTARKYQRNAFGRCDGDEDSKKEEQPSQSSFRTAKAELQVQQQQKNAKKSLGGKAAVNSKFVCPFKRDKEREDEKKSETAIKDGEPEDERLRGIDPKLIELIRNEIMDSGALVTWDDVAGLEHAKKIIKEIVVLPMLRPDIFTGLRRPPKGMLLFGPPGTGKTLIGKCIASQSKSTFFSISASSLTSKWIGEGEKMVRALFAVARVHQPSVIFIDEIDSLLTQRSETEHESSRRIKTEFLVQLDGAATGEEDRILVIGATNRPQELDEAARRRFVKRLYVPLPEFEARRQIVENLLASERHELQPRDIQKIAELTDHYSGADMTNLCKEASMGPIRSIPFELLENIRKEDVRCVTAEDFSQAIVYVRPSVSQADLGLYVNWDRTYGSGTSSVNSV